MGLSLYSQWNHASAHWWALPWQAMVGSSVPGHPEVGAGWEFVASGNGSSTYSYSPGGTPVNPGSATHAWYCLRSPPDTTRGNRRLWYTSQRGGTELARVKFAWETDAVSITAGDASHVVGVGLNEVVILGGGTDASPTYAQDHEFDQDQYSWLYCVIPREPPYSIHMVEYSRMGVGSSQIDRSAGLSSVMVVDFVDSLATADTVLPYAGFAFPGAGPNTDLVLFTNRNQLASSAVPIKTRTAGAFRSTNNVWVSTQIGATVNPASNATLNTTNNKSIMQRVSVMSTAGGLKGFLRSTFVALGRVGKWQVFRDPDLKMWLCTEELLIPWDSSFKLRGG